VQRIVQLTASKLTPFLPSDSFRAVAVHEKGDPGLLWKTGAYRPDGVRGWGLGARPPGTASFNATRPMRFLPGIFSSLRRRAARAPQCIVNHQTGYPSACGDILGKGKRRRGLALRLFAF
jgi:hypothetical protein